MDIGVNIAGRNASRGVVGSIVQERAGTAAEVAVSASS
jgi:hypothetical protein